jgi:site-specific DNA-methyltransferase (adenine-specific)
VLNLISRGNYQMELILGDCLTELKKLKDNSCDSLVTDPPYFLTGSTGRGFMGKSWDSLSVEYAVVEFIFKSMKVVLNTEEESIAEEFANININESELFNHSIAQCAKKVSKDIQQRSNPNTSFVQDLVLTKAEVLVLSNELLPSPIECLQNLPSNAYFVVDISFIGLQSRNIVHLVASILREDPMWLDQITSFSKMENQQKEKSLSEIHNGIGLEKKSTSEIIGHAENAASNVKNTLSNVITSNPTEFQKIITRITSLPSVKAVIKQCTNDQSFIPNLSEIFHYKWAKAVYQVLKPGAHGLIFGGTRTYHRLVSALEDAGFECRDQIVWVHGQGFPKSLNVGKQTGMKEHEGLGTALKPALEPICLIRKPLAERTVAANVLAYGTGAINIDASRIGITDKVNFESNQTFDNMGYGGASNTEPKNHYNPLGRFPANLVLSHNEDCVEVGTKKVKGSHPVKAGGGFADKTYGVSNKVYSPIDNKRVFDFTNSDGTETVAAWECGESCAVKLLDAQSGVLKNGGVKHKLTEQFIGTSLPIQGHLVSQQNYAGDSGGASRFFYCAKASKRERNAGCEGLPKKLNDFQRETSGLSTTMINGLRQKGNCGQPNSNHHPTVKPIKLMSYLITMITPPGGTCLDPFCGSGSTGVAAIKAGFDFIGIEQNEDYLAIAEKRIPKHSDHCTYEDYMDRETHEVLVAKWHCVDGCPLKA